jgi:general stress protein YciG
MTSKPKKPQGFATMSKEKQRDLARRGGVAAHRKGTAHEWTSEAARVAGRKGGTATIRRRREQAQAPAAAAEKPESEPEPKS